MELGTNSGSLYYVNAVIMTVCMWMLPALYVVFYEPVPIPWFSGYDGFVLLVLLVIVHKMGFYIVIGYMSRKESHIVLQLCPPVVLLITGFAIHYLREHYRFGWLDYALIPQWCVIYILARFGSPGDGCPFHKVVKVAARISRAILLVAVIWGIAHRFGPMGFLGLLGPLVLGNLQTPLALARIMISWVWLFWNETEIYDTENENVKLAVKILYIMVMCQGILYILACILESLSFLLRRSLAFDCGLVDKSGMGSIDLYYEQAYDTFLQESVFDTTKKMSLVTFAVDSLNPKSSRDNKSAAVRILDSFMQRRNKTCYIYNTKLISLITTSPKAVTTLINMLGWTVTEDADIRLFAAKVTAHLAPHVQIIRIPGTMQMVSSLLDAQDEPMTHGILVQIVDGNGGNADDDQQVSNGASSPTVNGNESDVEDRQQMGHGSSNSPLGIEGGNMPAVQASLTPATRNNSEGCSVIERICRFLGYVQKLWSIPQEDFKDEDSLPALGMNILEGLAHDLRNCEEISRTTELLPKIIGFISYRPGPTTSHREEITTSSLKLVRKLASIKGGIGIKLRRELSDNPFLIGNLAEILEDEGNSSYLEQSKLAMYIITNIAMDKKTRQEIGTVQAIIDKLVQEFIGEEELSNPLRAEAGQALAMLAIESPNNCSAMLHKTSELIGDLANKLQRGVHVYQAVSLLQSLCKNSRQLVLSHQGSDDRLLSTMTVVLGRIKDAGGKQLEALIGLASKICSVMSERIAPVLDPFADDEAFVKKLVGELNARKKPCPDEFPEMRSLLVELTVSIVEFCPRYAPIFKEHRMMEALSKVERYTGEVSEEARALRAIVATAKRLIGTNTP